MSENAKVQWTKSISSKPVAYPAEYVIRIFKGSYPFLNISQNGFLNKKICDIGCGDGRNMALLKECGFDIYGVEITQEIVNKVKDNLQQIGISDMEIKVGANDDIPFADKYFDYLLSWNACYYMGNKMDFDKHVDAFARVIKDDGYLVLSIPKKSCFIYKNCIRKDNGYAEITNDPFNVRNGEILRIFEDTKEIEDTFSKHFDRFVFGSIHDDCFGFDYHWHLVVCQKKKTV